jgi:integrase
MEYLDGRTTGWLFCTASGAQLDEPAVWRLLQSLAKRAGLPLRGPHGVKGDAVIHALAKPDARPDKVQQWADHKDSRTTQLYNRRRELTRRQPRLRPHQRRRRRPGTRPSLTQAHAPFFARGWKPVPAKATSILRRDCSG